MMEDLTWTCHVCGKERPDDKISVYTRHRTLPGGVQMSENIRHCNDKDECIIGAREVHFVKED